MDENDAVRRIRQKLADVRRPVRRWWHAMRGHYALGDPLAEADIAAFETEHEIALPSAYRLFLREIGHGGYGPHCGLVPLQDWNLMIATKPNIEPDHLATPSHLKAGGKANAVRSDSLDYPTYPGTMTVGRHDPYYTQVQLIVSGDMRGRLAYINSLDPPSDNFPPFVPPDPNFLAWYERWLDLVLAGDDTGHGFPGFDTKPLRRD